MQAGQLTLGRWILVGALLLCATLVVAHEAVSRIAYERSIRGIATVTDNTTPSMLHLGQLRRAVRESALDVAVDAEDSDLRRRLQARWPVIESHLQAYLALPALPGETASRAHLVAAIARLKVTEEHLLATVDGSERRAEAEQELLGVMGEVPGAVDILIAENARATAESADAVVLAHARASTLSLALVIVVVLAFTVTGVVACYVLTRVEEQVERRLEELDAFAGRVAHDLKGPLHPALLATNQLQREAVSPVGAQALERLERSLHRASALVDGLLAFARAAARPAPGARADVGQVAHELAPALQQLATDESAELSFDLAPGLVVAADPSVVSSIVENLARNAVLHLGVAPRREVRVVARAADGDGVLTVIDTGPGIPADVQQRLFRPFERGSDRPGGSGLGLATVKRLAQAHGGSVEVRSQVGAGSTFIVRLPLAAEAAVDAGAAHRAPAHREPGV